MQKRSGSSGNMGETSWTSLILLWIGRRWLRPTIATAWLRFVAWLGAIAAARLPVLGPWPALRSGSACPRMIGVLSPYRAG